jgi:hypothetical protein
LGSTARTTLCDRTASSSISRERHRSQVSNFASSRAFGADRLSDGGIVA